MELESDITTPLQRKPELHVPRGVDEERVEGRQHRVLPREAEPPPEGLCVALVREELSQHGSFPHHDQATHRPNQRHGSYLRIPRIMVPWAGQHLQHRRQSQFCSCQVSARRRHRGGGCCRRGPGWPSPGSTSRPCGVHRGADALGCKLSPRPPGPPHPLGDSGRCQSLRAAQREVPLTLALCQASPRPTRGREPQLEQEASAYICGGQRPASMVCGHRPLRSTPRPKPAVRTAALAQAPPLLHPWALKRRGAASRP
mmetsp:Transcript_3529/g.10950  ORF Transcript_3529/g.10950 Transcript_3529/m.10950 type:complete len:257 (+) Transcript_3529:1677-2447(+)